MESDTYDPNDLGFDRSNNQFENEVFLEYNIYESFWRVLEMYNEIDIEYNQLYAPREYTSLEIGFHNRTLFKNKLTVGFGGSLEPLGTHDYFEPRNDGWFVKYPASYFFRIFFSPDYAKTFVVDISPGIGWGSDYNQLNYNLRVAPRYRVNDHLMFVLSGRYSFNRNNLGYVTDSLDHEQLRIIFGRRNIENITTTFSINYAINTKFNFNLRLRHYYFKVDYDQYYNLDKEGNLHLTDYSGDDDFLYSSFNVDAYFTWLFAPGSEMVLAWKNAIYADDELPSDGYFKEFAETLQSPAANLISLKILYYLDAHYLKRLKRKPDSE
jgi:hypothetical protein